MLDHLLGNKSIEKILFFLIVNERCYATQLHHHFKTPLTPIQQGLLKLEKGGILSSYIEGKTRFFQFNPHYPCLKELESLLKKAYSLSPALFQKKYYCPTPRTSSSQSALHASSSELNQKQKDVILNHVWKRLAQIHALSFSAKSKSLSRSGWNGTGKGTTETTFTDENTLIFQEKGVWLSEEEQEFDFSNVFRWTRDSKLCAITLEHLRFGPLHPVFLFHLSPITENILESTVPHICNEDTYFGQMSYDNHFIQLKWRILGPKKNEEIDYLYT